MKKNSYNHLLAFIFLLAGCAKQTQVISPTTTVIPPTAAITLPTETPTAPTTDPAIFGVIRTNEIQAFALESVANAIFKKTMDGFVANGSVQEYQVTSVTIFPGGDGLISEIIFNIKTSDAAWLKDGGAQSADGWINGDCSRFDFFTTETEYQLKNKRLCS